MRPAQLLTDAGRGVLIGTAEIIPGVSGGTVALIVGVYETALESAGHLVRGVVRGVLDPLRGRGTAAARSHLAQVRWTVMVPLLVGMIAAVLVASALLAPVIEDHPVQARAVFAGLILASLIVPARMVGGRWRPHEVVAALGAAAAAVALTSLPTAGDAEPSLILVALAAAFAICALVLPGVSGSFLLLTVGMYAPTLDAVNERNLAYLGAFALGAVIGLSLFISGLQWLLRHRRRMTLAIMTGLMAGSLRALWPWQTDSGALQPPSGDLSTVLLLFLGGIAVVTALIAVDAAVQRRRVAPSRD
ncbi:DUF368 domain-containing protein [Nakamurella leprariae]|uniref:DUF368 domain-containing protein n=1 Tax=Nakamurella leprariae TaxID=2803911 RepID=A0A938YCQ1_9ACTN|nr:DUF368 domain-containing protein [Nakamurella leprariae]MBM9468227.1 DUF368 domain-containing protein [Nakamurella leprariae]